MVEAVGAAADGEDWRSLDALGNRHAREEVPPALEVLDEVGCRREVFRDETRFTAEVRFDRTGLIPFEQVLRRRLLPALDEGAEEEVVVRVLDRVALALVDILGGGELGRRHDVDDALRHDFAAVDRRVHVVGECVDLVLPEVGERGEEARLVAVERRVADRRLGLVGIAGEAAAKRRCGAGEHAGAAVARLDVLGDEGGDTQVRFAARAEVDHRRFLELLDRVVDRLLDRDDHVLAAEVVGELLRESLRRRGVEDARHVDEQQILRADDLRVERGGHGRVDAARDADDDLLHVDVREEVADAVVERAVDVGDVRLIRLFLGRHILHPGERQDGQRLFVLRQRAHDMARLVVSRARAVEGVDGLAVVLQADAVDIEERHAGLARLAAEDAVALVILAERVRRSGDVDVEVELFLLLEQLERCEFVVVAPAVLAEQAAHAVVVVANLERDGGEQLRRRRAELARELLQAEEVARVVELAVVRHERLDGVGVGHVVRLDELAVARDEEGVVLAHAAVVVLLLPVDGDVAEHDGDVLRGRDDVAAIALAVAQEGALLPRVAEEVTRHRHLREDDDVGALSACLLDEAQDRGGVHIWMAGDDLHLSHGNFQQLQHPFCYKKRKKNQCYPL